MKYAARWKVLLHALRIFGTGIALNNTQTGYDFDGRLIDVQYEDTDCLIIDWETGDLLAVYSEDGYPDVLSDWLREPMSIDGVPTDFPLYEA